MSTEQTGQPASLSSTERVLTFRREEAVDNPWITLPSGVLDLRSGVLKRTDGTSVTFTRTELSLITYLIAAAPRVCSVEELLSSVWGYSPSSNTRTVTVTASRVRQKLKLQVEEGDCIVADRGRGYHFERSPERKRVQADILADGVTEQAREALKRLAIFQSPFLRNEAEQLVGALSETAWTEIRGHGEQVIDVRGQERLELPLNLRQWLFEAVPYAQRRELYDLHARIIFERYVDPERILMEPDDAETELLLVAEHQRVCDPALATEAVLRTKVLINDTLDDRLAMAEKVQQEATPVDQLRLVQFRLQCEVERGGYAAAVIEAGEQALQQALTLKEHTLAAELSLVLALHHQRSARHEEALQRLNACVFLPLPPILAAQVRLRLAVVHMGANQFSAAEALLAALVADPEPQIVHNARGIWVSLLLREGRVEEANRRARELVADALTDARPMLQFNAQCAYAATLVAIGQNDAANRLLTQLLVHPAGGGAHLALGRVRTLLAQVQFLLGNVALAEKQLEVGESLARESARDRSDIAVHRGWFAWFRGDVVAAKGHFAEAVDRFPLGIAQLSRAFGGDEPLQLAEPADNEEHGVYAVLNAARRGEPLPNVQAGVARVVRRALDRS